MKDIARVLDALRAGCETSLDIEAYCGLDRAHAAAYLSELHKAGVIVQTHRQSRRTGRAFARWRLKEAA